MLFRINVYNYTQKQNFVNTKMNATSAQMSATRVVGGGISTKMLEKFVTIDIMRTNERGDFLSTLQNLGGIANGKKY